MARFGYSQPNVLNEDLKAAASGSWSLKCPNAQAGAAP